MGGSGICLRFGVSYGRREGRWGGGIGWSGRGKEVGTRWSNGCGGNEMRE